MIGRQVLVSPWTRECDLRVRVSATPVGHRAAGRVRMGCLGQRGMAGRRAREWVRGERQRRL
jgi:hypothetical protein